jgi:hypothetical protein
LLLLFAICINDTGVTSGKFTAGEIDADGKFATVFIDISGAPWYTVPFAEVKYFVQI